MEGFSRPKAGFAVLATSIIDFDQHVEYLLSILRHRHGDVGRAQSRDCAISWRMLDGELMGRAELGKIVYSSELQHGMYPSLQASSSIGSDILKQPRRLIRSGRSLDKLKYRYPTQRLECHSTCSIVDLVYKPPRHLTLPHLPTTPHSKLLNSSLLSTVTVLQDLLSPLYVRLNL